METYKLKADENGTASIFFEQMPEDIAVMNAKYQADIVVPYLTFPVLEETDCVISAFSTRNGGVSTGMYSSMNLSFARGDESEAVIENRSRILSVLNLADRKLVTSAQTHTTNVCRVDRADGKGISERSELRDVDGLITNDPSVVLLTYYADCVPLYFVDPVHKAIGLSHSGWRGTVLNMAGKTAEAMEREFATNPNDLICAIGPSICKDCYEVSEDVAEQFLETFKNSDRSIVFPIGNGKYKIDLWESNRQLLLSSGVREEQIHTAGICTCCNHKILFSHRGSQGRRGNLAALLALKDINEHN